MKNKLKTVRNIFIDELSLISKDINVLMVILLAPLFYAFFYGSIYFNKSETDVPVAIVDMSQSEISRQLIREIDSHQLVYVKYSATNFNEAVSLVNDGDASGIILFPKDMSENLKNGIGSELKIYLNTSRFLISNDLNKGINEVVGYFNASVRLKYFMSNGLGKEQAINTIEPVAAEIKPMYNNTDNYGDFLIPAIFVLILQQTLLIGLAESFAKQRENGTLKNLYDATEGKIRFIIFGKGLFYVLLYTAYALLFYTLVFNVFSLSIKGNLVALLLSTVIFIYAVTALAFFLATFFKEKITALHYLTFSSYPVFLISGYTWPFEALPLVLRIIAYTLPSTPFFELYTKIGLMGSSIETVFSELIHLTILAIVWTVAATIRLKQLNKSIHNTSFTQNVIASQ